MRNFLNEAAQKKYFLMFVTAVVYIIGLFAFFTHTQILLAAIGLLAGIFLILKNYLSPKLIIFWYLIFLAAFFNAELKIKNFDSLYLIAPQKATVEGRISSIPNATSNSSTKFFFDAEKVLYNHQNKDIKAKTLINITGASSTKKYKIGDSYKISGKLMIPLRAGNPSQFDYAKYLQNFNVFTVMYAKGDSCVYQDSRLPLKWRFLQGLDDLRSRIILSHGKFVKSPNLEILGGIVFGDDAVSAPDSIKKSFINSGLLHILAASGMNVALIYGIWFFILIRLRVPFKITVTSGILVIIFYALMTGLGPSVIRAAFMLIFILIGKLLDRDAHSISLLSLVALMMLVYNPAYINDIGFQLSFVVTFGLLLSAPAVFDKVKLPVWLSGAIFIPLIAQIWVAPIQMYYFNNFSLYSVFANILSVPFVTAISFGGFISSILAIIKPISIPSCAVFDFFLNPIISGLVFVSEFFSRLPHSLLTTIKPSLIQMGAYYVLVVCLTLMLKEYKSKRLIATAIICALLLGASFVKIPDEKLETIVFDVQNADAFLIKTPKNRYFIIDSGKQGFRGRTQAQAIILKYMKDHGIYNIEGFIITHFDSDHAGGATDLINNLKIKTLYVASLNDSSKIAQKIYKAAKNREVKIEEARNAKIIYFEPKILIKTLRAEIKNGNDNENSVITLISSWGFDELFMGDAGVEAFYRVKKLIPKDIEVFKVGHHGAKDVVDTAMLNYLNPQLVLISTGKNNYGHPHPYTVKMLEKKARKVLRTDRQNSIKITYKASQAEVLHWNRNSASYKTIPINISKKSED